MALLSGVASLGMLLSEVSRWGIAVVMGLYLELRGVARIGTKSGAKSKVNIKNAIRFCILSFKVGTPISECNTSQTGAYSVYSCGCECQDFRDNASLGILRAIIPRNPANPHRILHRRLLALHPHLATRQ